jgi:hypothetical protein
VTALELASGGGDEPQVVFLSEIQGVTLTDALGNTVSVQAESVDEGFVLSIEVASHALGSSHDGEGGDDGSGDLQSQLGCKFYDKTLTVWSGKGVFLRGVGLQITPGFATVSAICVSSHLTMFTVADDSTSNSVVEAKVHSLAKRVDALNGIDLLSGNTKLNPLIPSIFAALSALFLALVVAAKLSGRKGAVKEARVLFARSGRLNRPVVLGGDETEAVLRAWLRPGMTAWMIVLQVVTVNPFVALFFRWSHESIVFTRSDKAFLLYTGVITSFLVRRLPQRVWYAVRVHGTSSLLCCSLRRAGGGVGCRRRTGGVRGRRWLRLYNAVASFGRWW